MSRLFRAAAVAGLLTFAAPLMAQQRNLAKGLREFVKVDAPVIALTHVRLVDGTGTSAKEDQTIIIRDETIDTVGRADAIKVPANARVIDLKGKTVIPGIVGLHDHMYYGGMQFMGESYPPLFLSAGVTTIRTAGSVDSYQELNIKRQIDSLNRPGPAIVVTGPYLQGYNSPISVMKPVEGAEGARRVVRYWAEEGVTWLKAYTTITSAELGAAIDEAHKHGVKVTAHLCSVGFREAVALGIDQLEHGYLTNTEYNKTKRADACPAGDAPLYAGLDIDGPEVQQTIREMVAKKVALTSTLDVHEISSPSRVPFDQRVLDALAPRWATAVTAFYERGKTANDAVAREGFKKAMQFERAFVKAGGLLGAGSDPCCQSAIAGYGDQRNFELLVEAGFTPEEAVQVMTSNGAKILGFDRMIGTIAAGMQADLVVLDGDPTKKSSDIRKVQLVFRRGIGFDPEKLRNSVKGQVGLK